MSQKVPTPEQAATIMTAYTEDALGYAREAHQVDLDFSESSLAEVEMMLGELHDSLP